jgi:hypothetical protein
LAIVGTVVALGLAEPHHGPPDGLPSLWPHTPAVASGAVALGQGKPPVLTALRDVLSGPERPVAAPQDALTDRGRSRAGVATAVGAAQLVLARAVRVPAAELGTQTHCVGVQLWAQLDWGVVGGGQACGTLLATAGAAAAETGVETSLSLTHRILVALSWAGPFNYYIVSGRTQQL